MKAGRPPWVWVLACAGVLGTTACSERTRLPEGADVGSKPRLAEPVTGLIPTVHIAPASPWPAGLLPLPAAGLRLTAFARGLAHPRWLLVLPNGDVLVAETNAPPREKAGGGVKGWVMKLVMARAGAGVPSANRITLLRDADGDGVAEMRSVLLEGLNSPFGMAVVGDRLYVAHTDAIWEYAYAEGQTRIDRAGRKLAELPGGPRNHHWTKGLVADAGGGKLYASVGSNSNVAEHGMAEEAGRAAIWEIDRASGAKRLFATGLRNPVGLAWMRSITGADRLWAVVNERDEIGSDLVPDYLTSVQDGAFYGWPYSWYGPHVDDRVSPPQPALVARAVVPDYALGAHVAALGLATGTNPALAKALLAGSRAPVAAAAGAASGEGMFIGLHGSWNRRPHAGYKVVYVPFIQGMPSGLPVDVLTGFLSPEGQAWGRPVGVAMDRHGALLVADDVGNSIWRVATPP
jgi:glucose/arabinose dehydrogenase